MKLTDLPDCSDEEAIRKFAASFDGYEHFGSFEACAENAKQKNRATLADLRNELFFAFRAARHTDNPQKLIEAWRELKPFFEQIVGLRSS